MRSVIPLLLDQGLPRSIVRHLAERGIKAGHGGRRLRPDGGVAASGRQSGPLLR